MRNNPNLTIGSNETTGAEIIINRNSGNEDVIQAKFGDMILHSLGIITSASLDSMGVLISANGLILHNFQVLTM